jgi:UDP-glucose 4-epimerase
MVEISQCNEKVIQFAHTIVLHASILRPLTYYTNWMLME